MNLAEVQAWHPSKQYKAGDLCDDGSGTIYVASCDSVSCSPSDRWLRWTNDLFKSEFGPVESGFMEMRTGGNGQGGNGEGIMVLERQREVMLKGIIVVFPLLFGWRWMNGRSLLVVYYAFVACAMAKFVTTRR